MYPLRGQQMLHGVYITSITMLERATSEPWNKLITVSCSHLLDHKFVIPKKKNYLPEEAKLWPKNCGSTQDNKFERNG